FGTFARSLLKDYFAHALIYCLQSKDNQLIRGYPDFLDSLFIFLGIHQHTAFGDKFAQTCLIRLNPYSPKKSAVN
uniref:hypothetical protein n=1 Tax=Rhodoflexus caldus TaxID=2891236 RepID=UPI00202A937C